LTRLKQTPRFLLILRLYVPFVDPNNTELLLEPPEVFNGHSAAIAGPLVARLDVSAIGNSLCSSQAKTAGVDATLVHL